jgi:hypothetical protein
MQRLKIETQIAQAHALSVRLEFFLIGKPHKTKTTRDHICLRYWSLILETHQGIMVLLNTKHYGPAFALMRPLVESFLRLFLEIGGTEAQRKAIRGEKYSTDFGGIGEQIDRQLKLDPPILGPWFRKHKDTLHGFTHGGMEQLVRRGKGRDIVPNYPAREVRDVVLFTNLFALMTALITMEFLGFDAELQTGLKMLGEHFRLSKKAKRFSGIPSRQ